MCIRDSCRSCQTLASVAPVDIDHASCSLPALFLLMSVSVLCRVSASSPPGEAHSLPGAAYATPLQRTIARLARSAKIRSWVPDEIEFISHLLLTDLR